MDQGVIESMKKNYKKYFLRRLLFGDNNNEYSSMQLIKKWTLHDTVFAVSNAWKDVMQKTLVNTWKKLSGEELLPDTADIVTSTIMEMLGEIHGSHSYSTSDSKAWMQDDADIHTYNEPSDGEIIERVLGTNNFEVCNYEMLLR